MLRALATEYTQGAVGFIQFNTKPQKGYCVLDCVLRALARSSRHVGDRFHRIHVPCAERCFTTRRFAPASTRSFAFCEPPESRIAPAAIVAHWIGGSGNWSDPAHWDIGAVPNRVQHAETLKPQLPTFRPTAPAFGSLSANGGSIKLSATLDLAGGNMNIAGTNGWQLAGGTIKNGTVG